MHSIAAESAERGWQYANPGLSDCKTSALLMNHTASQPRSLKPKINKQKHGVNGAMPLSNGREDHKAKLLRTNYILTSVHGVLCNAVDKRQN